MMQDTGPIPVRRGNEALWPTEQSDRHHRDEAHGEPKPCYDNDERVGYPEPDHRPTIAIDQVAMSIGTMVRLSPVQVRSLNG